MLRADIDGAGPAFATSTHTVVRYLRMNESERFEKAMRSIFAVEPDTAAAIRRGEVSAPGKAGAVRPAEDQDRAASAREVDRRSDASQPPSESP